MAYADLGGIHTPADGVVPPAAWGAQVNDNLIAIWDGLAQPWQTWTPTWNGITAGASDQEGMFHRIGFLVTGFTQIRFGAGFAVTGPVSVPLPLTATSNTRAIGRGLVRSADIAIAPRFLGVVVEFASPTVGLLSCADGDLSSTQPVTFAELDIITIGVTYEPSSSPPAGELL